MTVLSDIDWIVYVEALPSALNGHMTKYNPVTGTYDDTVSLYYPLQINAIGAAGVNGTAAVAGPNGPLVYLSDTSEVLASATMSDINTAGSYFLGYYVNFSQQLYYIDPGLAFGYTYHLETQFIAQASY